MESDDLKLILEELKDIKLDLKSLKDLIKEMSLKGSNSQIVVTGGLSPKHKIIDKWIGPSQRSVKLKIKKRK